MPAWWPVLRAAKYLGVPAWELAKQSKFWTNIGNEAASAEIAVENASNPTPGGYDPSMPPGAVPGAPL